MQTTAYCTMFDSGYLARGLALIHSLRTQGVHDDIWVLCLDETTESFLERLALPGVHTTTPEALEQYSPGLEASRTTRSRVEFFFTCTPALVRFVLAQEEEVTLEWVVYLDSDMYFYTNPTHLFAAMGSGDVGIVPHRFPDRLHHLQQYGTFNVAWVMFRNTTEGIACVEWWRDRCIEWCFDRRDGGRYADQGYLDQFSKLFPTTVVLKDPGINVAPWNLGRHTISAHDDAISVDGCPLVFYHFHGLRKRENWIYPNLAMYKTQLEPVVRDKIYLPYIADLIAIEHGALEINLGHPIPTAHVPSVTRNQHSIRSAGYRARRRMVQIMERRAGGAFRLDRITAETMQSRNYG